MEDEQREIRDVVGWGKFANVRFEVRLFLHLLPLLYSASKAGKLEQILVIIYEPRYFL